MRESSAGRRRLNVVVHAAARRDAIVGMQGDAFKLAVVAPPEKGRANDAVCRLLARALGLSPAAVRVVQGRSSRRKVVEVHAAGDPAAQLLRQLAAPPAGREEEEL